jgi:CRP-like cAMP-binding protein
MTRDAIKRILTSIPLFADLPPGDLDALSSASRSVSFKRGARIFEEGAVGDCCYVLTHGKARVVLAGRGGTEILLNILTAPALVGEIALLDKSTRSASLVAAEDCHLIRIPAQAFEALRRNAMFEQRLVARVVITLRESDVRHRVSSFPSINRIVWTLGRIARYGATREGAAIVIDKPAHHDLAEMAGCTRETVSRALQTLKRKKCLSWDADKMRLDFDALQRYVDTELVVPAAADARSRQPGT